MDDPCESSGPSAAESFSDEINSCSFNRYVEVVHWDIILAFVERSVANIKRLLVQPSLSAGETVVLLKYDSRRFSFIKIFCLLYL